MSRASTVGQSIGAADGYIAATAAANRMAVATRDTAAFEAAGVPVINPWRNTRQ
jgi:predicted nucleic acid-binding protein